MRARRRSSRPEEDHAAGAGGSEIAHRQKTVPRPAARLIHGGEPADLRHGRFLARNAVPPNCRGLPAHRTPRTSAWMIRARAGPTGLQALLDGLQDAQRRSSHTLLVGTPLLSKTTNCQPPTRESHSTASRVQGLARAPTTTLTLRTPNRPSLHLFVETPAEILQGPRIYFVL